MQHELCIFETDSIYVLCRIKHIRQINHYKQPIFMAKMHENNFSSHEYFNLSMKSNEILDALYKLQPFSPLKTIQSIRNCFQND